MPDIDDDDEPTDWSQMRDWRQIEPKPTWGAILLAVLPLAIGMVWLRDPDQVMGAWNQIVSAWNAR